MFDRYFGIPQQVIRMGLWAQMRPSEQSLYVCLMHESERHSTRRLQKTDAYLSKMAGLSPRAFCNARKKLQERGLVVCSRGIGNVYAYTLCNPETSNPWPGDPKQRILYRKKDTGTNEPSTLPVRSPKPEAQPSPKSDALPLEHHGVPIKF